METPRDEGMGDLEIISIGALYQGPCDKKYWSCSRGKDRYPYPVGYRVVRTHAGTTYDMEIHEGPKGPLFVVTSTEGDPSTGQTPDIAWENFHKKSGPRVKTWHGKRLSSKIDGAELFGFRNPFVQRLLRELVANVDRVAENSFLSNTSNEASLSDQNTGIRDSNGFLDLSLCLGNQQSTGKISTKNKKPSKNVIKELRAKRIRRQDLSHDMQGDTSEQLGQLYSHAKDNIGEQIQKEYESLSKVEPHAIHGTYNHLSHSLKGSVAAVNDEKLHVAVCERQNDHSDVGCVNSISDHLEKDCLETLSIQVSTAAENNFQARNDLQRIPGHLDCFVDKHVVSQVESKTAGREGSRYTCMSHRLYHANNKQFGKSLDVEPTQEDSLVVAKDNDAEFPVLVRDLDVCVPDTCDTAKDGVAGFLLDNGEGGPGSMKDELVAANPMSTASTSCGLEVVSGSLPKEMSDTSNPCTSKCMPMPEEVSHPVKCLPDAAILKGEIKDSLPEVGSCSGSSSTSSEKIDLELAGQELARSMMTFLLPQAVPLLKKTHLKRRTRHRNKETKVDPHAVLPRASSADQNVRSDHLTVSICQGKLQAERLVQAVQVDLPEKINDPEKLLGVNSCEMTKVNVCVSVAGEQFNGSGSTKDVNSVVPDSFEGDQFVYDLSLKGPSPADFNGAFDGPSDANKTNIGTSKSFNNKKEKLEKEPFNLANDGCSGVVVVPNGLEKNEALLSDSIAEFLEEEYRSECMKEKEKVLCPDPSYLGADAEKEISILGCMAQHNVSRFHKAELFEHVLPAPNSTPSNLEEKDICKTVVKQSHSMLGNPGKNHQELVSIEKQATMDSRDTNVENLAGASNISQVGPVSKPVVTGQGSSLLRMPNGVLLTGGLLPDMDKKEKLPQSPHSSKTYRIPISESIIYRNLTDNIGLEAGFSSNTVETPENGMTGVAIPTNKDAKTRKAVANEINVDEHMNHLRSMENFPTSEATFFIAAPPVQNQYVVKNVTEGMNSNSSFRKFSEDAFSKFHASGEYGLPHCQESRMDVSNQSGDFVLEALSRSDKNPVTKSTVEDGCKVFSHNQIYWKNHSDGSSSIDASSSKETDGSMELIGCFLHPNPVLYVYLNSKEDYFQIGVLCGHVEGNHRDLFLYRAPLQEQKANSPFFIGYTSLVLPSLNNRNVPVERSSLQLIPDGQYLVILNSIKAPYCREQSISCLCPTCELDCCEDNAVKVVQIKFGYVSPVAKLMTADKVSCILVCEPNYLIAVEESGGLHAWIMNSGWSAIMEEFTLPSFDYLAPMVLELRRVPRSNSLLIGHNGLGGFGLWDISKRVLLTRFTAPGNTVFQVLPVCWSGLQNEGTLATGLGIDEHMKEIGLVTNYSVAESGEKSSSPEEIAVWLLVSAASDSETQHDHQVKEPSTSSVGWWRLALLVKNTMVLGSVLDPRAFAVDVSTDYGIIGTVEGVLYKWELSTGEVLASVRPFKCGSISCIAVDAKSDAVAVAGDKCQLLIYAQPRGK